MNTTTPHISINLNLAASLGLTERQAESAAWAAEGKVDEEIGMIIGRTARTAKSHIINAMQRTETHTRAQLVAMMFINGVFTAKQSVVALVVCICIFTTTAAGFDNDIARRGRTRRGRDYASLEEANDIPEFLDKQLFKLKGHYA
ncbi:helix-turn-helix transcriptional regulator [uncultured Amphritea sp.]|uniref:helix-turn-helix domain-containing protein n=1 Tax=uncultured Amphritea sp. TaxID=981605 RepID=UPI00260BE889|nr:helix-turn-helix transcriptional regulator [uncultured Amphritea sp.]